MFTSAHAVAIISHARCRASLDWTALQLTKSGMSLSHRYTWNAAQDDEFQRVDMASLKRGMTSLWTANLSLKHMDGMPQSFADLQHGSDLLRNLYASMKAVGMHFNNVRITHVLGFRQSAILYWPIGVPVLSLTPHHQWRSAYSPACC